MPKATPTIATDRGNMPRSLLASALLLLATAAALTACGPVDPAYYPAMAQAPQPDLQGTATVQAQEYQAAIFGTSVAQTAVADGATLQAAAERGTSAAVIERIEAEKSGTREAVVMQVTSVAAALQLTQAARNYAATDTAYPATTTASVRGTATGDAKVAFDAQVTQTAAAIVLRDEQEKREWAQLKRETFMVLGTIFVIALLVMLFFGILAVYRVVILRLEARASLWDTRKGAVQVWREPDGRLMFEGVTYPELLPETAVPTYNSAAAANVAPAVEQLSRSVWASDMPERSKPDGVGELAKRLIRDAIAVVGEEANQVPRWETLKRAGIDWITSEKQQRIVAALGPDGAGVLDVRPGVGTFVSDMYIDLGNLLYALETGQIKVRPTPLPRDGAAAD